MIDNTHGTFNEEWILQSKETRRTFSTSSWVPLRASINYEKGMVREVGYSSECFGCGSAAFPLEHREIVEERLGWSDIGVGRDVQPYAYKDGYYSSIEQYQYNDKEPIGVNLVFDHPQPVVGGRLWILNPDLVVALRLIKEGANWVRPEENFVVVARELFNEKGEHCLIEIKREFLLDYLAARNLSLRLSYYRQRVENVVQLEASEYANLESHQEERNGGKFELTIRSLDDVFGGSWAMFRVWRIDVDEEEDAPVMGPEVDHNTDHESSQGYRGGYKGVRVEGEFWRDEWIEHQSQSTRIRGDKNENLPQFIVETDGKRMASADLNNENIGRWLWFRSNVVTELLGCRGFSLKWYTAETGGIQSTSGCRTHFGVNSLDLITVYAYDIARLYPWEQHIWAAHNVVPDGKVSSELLDSQVKAKPANTFAVEVLLFQTMRMLAKSFQKKYGISLFSHDIDDDEAMQQVSRFVSKDQASLLRLAKELIRVFSDRLNAGELRKLSDSKEKEKLGTNKLLENVLAQKVGADKARLVFATIAGTYDMRIGDAHPTGGKITDAIKLAGIDQSLSFLRQGQQLISNFRQSIWTIGSLLFEQSGK